MQKHEQLKAKQNHTHNMLLKTNLFFDPVQETHKITGTGTSHRVAGPSKL